MGEYRYTECGLENVMITGMDPVTDDAGEEVIQIPNVNGLHKAIAKEIVSHENSMSGKELRFLRTELGMTQAELANLVHRDPQSVGRWERGEKPINAAAETLIRAHVVQSLNLDGNMTIQWISERCVESAEIQTITIDGSNPRAYRKKEAA